MPLLLVGQRHLFVMSFYGRADGLVLLVFPGVVGVAGAVVVVVLIGIWVGNDAIVATVHAEVCQNGLHLHAEHVGVRLNIFFLDHSLFVFLQDYNLEEPAHDLWT